MLSADYRKRCGACGEEKAAKHFYLNKKGRQAGKLGSRCKACQKAAGRAIRLEVCAAYGGKCQCPHCPFNSPSCPLEFLTIDHVNGDGAERRRQGLEPPSKGYSFYKWLKDNGYPKDGFQCLCWCCNCGKGRSGQCPHVTHYLAAQQALLDSDTPQLSFDF